MPRLVIPALLVLVLALPGPAWTVPIQPQELTYLGAFRLPEGGVGSDWTYSGNAATHFPGGDPAGSADGFPGSLFATGNGTMLQVAEISIPVPVISAAKNPAELNTAAFLQPFSDVFGGLFPYLEQPRVGLCYLPPQAGQASGKVHYAFGLHLQDTGFEPSHGWFETNLSDPRPAGPWIFGGYSGYVTNDYLFEIPKAWADLYAPGLYLASGRCREGPWAGGGPGLFAYGPWNEGNPPAPGATLTNIRPLLLYGTQLPGLAEISFDASQTIPGHTDPDRWRGAAWLTAGDRSAVVFVGTKTVGRTWYGFADGTEWDYNCGQPGFAPCPQVPEWPYDNRGYWAEDFQAQMMFYSPDDLAAVAQGASETWAPQPYAVLDLSPFLFDPLYTVDDLIRYKRDFVGAVCFDRQNSLLYLFEMVAEEDGRSIVHVFRVQ